MIVGIGTDMIDVRRVLGILDRKEQRFLNRCFTRNEINYAFDRYGSGRAVVAARLASRMAAKEACAKALGTGFRQGIGWKDIEVIRGEHGNPELKLHGNAMVRWRMLMLEGRKPSLHLSMTDEKDYALAFVVLELL